MNQLSSVKKGSLRDRQILDVIDTCGVINTVQLTKLLFRFPTGQRKCQARMKSLYERNLVKKTRLSLDTSTAFYQGKFPGQIEHSLAVSWIYVWFMLKEGEKVLTWETEQLKEFGLRNDVLCSTFIPMTKEVRWYCIEYERSTSHNRFLKIAQYDALYQKEGVIGSKLMKRLGDAQRFPKVIIVTDSIKHAQKIKGLIAESITKVRYEVHLLNSIRDG